MDADLGKKVDRLISLLEEQELSNFRQSSHASSTIHRELILNVILASCVGYFIMRVLDHHFR